MSSVTSERRSKRGRRVPAGGGDGRSQSSEGSLWGRTALRFALAAGVVGGLFVWLRTPLYQAMARVVADLMAWTTPAGLLSAVAHAPPDRFTVDSLSMVFRVDAHSVFLPFLLCLPPALAWAVPRRRPWATVVLTLAGCFLLGALVLSQDLLAMLSRGLEGQGVALFPAWRRSFYEGWSILGWDLAMIAVPAAVCLALVSPLVDPGEGGPPGRDGAGKPDRPRSRKPAKADAKAGRHRPRRDPEWIAAATAAGALALLLALSPWARGRMANEEARREFLLQLAERDPSLPTYFLRNAEQAFMDGRHSDARLHLERALLFDRSRSLATAGLARLDGVEAQRKQGGG